MKKTDLGDIKRMGLTVLDAPIGGCVPAMCTHVRAARIATAAQTGIQMWSGLFGQAWEDAG